MKKILTFQQHINESVRHETKFVWWVKKDFTSDYAKTENDLAEDAVMGDCQDDSEVITFDSEGTEGGAKQAAADAVTAIKAGKFKVEPGEWKGYWDNMDEDVQAIEESETLLPDVSDERIGMVWDSAIGGNQPPLAKMRKDILDLMKREEISFTEMEMELDKNK